MKTFIKSIVSAAALLFAATGVSEALEKVTWVASNGSDQSASCTRAAPCRNVNNALGKTVEGGMIRILDAGFYGDVIVNKSVGIVGDVENALFAYLYIDAGDNGHVSIENVRVKRLDAAHMSGIFITGATDVFLSNVKAAGFYDGCGVNVLDHTKPIRVYMANSEVFQNKYGICLTSSANAKRKLFLDNSVVEANEAKSLRLYGTNASVALSNSRLAATPVELTNGAQLISLGNNFIAGDVGPTSTIPLE